MPANPPLYPPPPPSGPAPQGGPVQVPAQGPDSQRITSFPLTQMAVGMHCDVQQHEGKDNPLQHSGNKQPLLELAC